MLLSNQSLLDVAGGAVATGKGKWEEYGRVDRPSSRGAEILVAFAGVALAAAGNLAGNLVSAAASPWWTQRAPLVLALVALAEVVTALCLGNVRRFHRSRARRTVTVVLIAWAELLALVSGVLANLTMASLPQALTRYALPLFAGIAVLIALTAVFVYLRQRRPPSTVTTWQSFRQDLQRRYADRKRDALSDALELTPAYQAEPDALIAPPLASAAMPAMAHIGTGDLRPLPAGTPIACIYDDAGGHLLILGEPGAGKSTQLVKLGLELLGRLEPSQQARGAEDLRLPVLFNLSTWAHNHLKLEDWLVEELDYAYQVSPKRGRKWVVGKRILPLLDGLDEVAEARLAECIGAINAFVRDNPQVPVVVCCRSDDFHKQPERLDLRAAVVVQPLADAQIMAYLAYGGEPWAALRAAVGTDSDLRDLMRTPLFLRLVTLTYEALPREAIPPVGAGEEYRRAWVQQLFQHYVARMLERSPASDQRRVYTKEEVERALAWLGQQMREHGQVEFYVERLQPDWLPAALMRRYKQVFWLYFWLVVALFGGLGGVLFGGWEGALGVGLGVCLGGGLVLRLRSGPIEPRPTIKGTLGDGLESGLFGPQRGWLFGALVGAPFVGLVGALIGALVGAQAGAVVGGLIGVLIGALLGVVVGARRAALVVALFDALGGSPRVRRSKDEDFLIPNEGMLRSAGNGVRSALVSGLVAGPAFGMAFGRVLGLRGGLVFGLFLGLFVALPFGLGLGGAAALQHLALRWVMRRERLVPRHLVDFLNYASQRILLQQVGGGFRFVHVLLRNYFADLATEIDPTRDAP